MHQVSLNILSYQHFTHVYNLEQIMKLRYKCPHFRILIIGRANAGKTTILEKVCGVQQGTKPIIYDQNGKLSLVKLKLLLHTEIFQVWNWQLLCHI